MPNNCQEVLQQWHINHEERSLGHWTSKICLYLLCIIQLCEICLVACLGSKCEDRTLSISSSHLSGNSSMNVFLEVQGWPAEIPTDKTGMWDLDLS